MKSARISSFTSKIEDIHVVDAPVADPGPGEVCVRILMSPVNPSDLNFLHGTYRAALERIIWNQGVSDTGTVFYDPSHTNPCPEPPYSLGGEGLGVVEATGSGFLARRLLGKRVAVAAGPPNGTWQEYTIANAKRVVAMPDGISDQQGAMFFVNPVTAYVLTRKVLRVPGNEWLLLTAAGSALGKSVVRLGKIYGFRTLCIVRSGANSEELLSLGADAVVETDSQNLVEEVFRLTYGRGVGYAIDCVGGDLAAQLVRCLGLDGRMILYGTLADDPLRLPIRDLMMPVAHISGFLLPNWMSQQSPLTLLGVLLDVKRLTLKGVFHSEVAETYPLERVADAVSASLQQGRTGKVMLRMGEQSAHTD